MRVGILQMFGETAAAVSAAALVLVVTCNSSSSRGCCFRGLHRHSLASSSSRSSSNSALSQTPEFTTLNPWLSALTPDLHTSSDPTALNPHLSLEAWAPGKSVDKWGARFTDLGNFRELFLLRFKVPLACVGRRIPLLSQHETRDSQFSGMYLSGRFVNH